MHEGFRMRNSTSFLNHPSRFMPRAIDVFAVAMDSKPKSVIGIIQIDND